MSAQESGLEKLLDDVPEGAKDSDGRVPDADLLARAAAVGIQVVSREPSGVASGSHSSLVPVPIDALSETVMAGRLERVTAWLKGYSGNTNAKNYKEILKIMGTDYAATAGETVEKQKFDALVAQVQLSRRNAPPRIACVFGRDKLRSPQTQQAYDQLSSIVNQGAMCGEGL
jgi:hypothetical protein